MAKSFVELRNESQKILESAYSNHYGVIQMHESGKKWVVKIKDKKVANIPVDDAATRNAWNTAILELRENEYIKPHLDMYKVTEAGYICVEKRNR